MKDWKKEKYRAIEALLNDFKNKKIGFTNFMDNFLEEIEETLKQRDKEIIREIEKLEATWISVVKNKGKKVLLRDTIHKNELINIIKNL